MKSLTFISDTHNRHNEIPQEQLPGGDFLIHTGDFTNRGTLPEVTTFLEWFSAQTQYKHRIFIAGNHEKIAEKDPSLFVSLVPDNCVYACNSVVNLDGLKFWGTPVTAQFCNWAFNRTTSELIKLFSYIPEDTDVLLTHGGPKGILQKLPGGLDVGMPELAERISQLPKLKVSAFGHIHHSYGTKTINNIQYVNSAIVGEDYKTHNKPITINL